MLGLDAIGSAAVASAGGEPVFNVTGVNVVAFGALALPAPVLKVTGSVFIAFGVPAIVANVAPQVTGTTFVGFGSPSSLRFTSSKPRHIRTRMSGFVAPKFGRPTL